MSFEDTCLFLVSRKGLLYMKFTVVFGASLKWTIMELQFLVLSTLESRAFTFWQLQRMH